MKRVLQSFYTKREMTIVFIVSFFLSAPYAVDICSGYLNYLGLDLQEFLLWHYTSLNNLVSYKDIFYPYGLFSYFKNYNVLYSFLYYLISPLLLTFTFFSFKKIFKDQPVLYFSFIIFYLFIFNVVGFQAFARYGIYVIISLVFSHALYSGQRKKSKMFFLSGAILGIIVSFITDIGVYLILSFITAYLLSIYIKVNKKVFKYSVVIGLGFLSGVIPLLFLLIHYGSIGKFWGYFSDVGEIVSVAKTPFFAFVDSPANIFTISILSFAIFYNFLKILFFKNKSTLSSCFQIILIFDILILEYKSIIRSIDRQIVFISLLLLMFLAYEILSFLIKNGRKRNLAYISLIVSATIIYGIFAEKLAADPSYILKNIGYISSNRCFENNLKVFLIHNPSYIEVINFIKRQPHFNGKIFSFPTGDSTFYVLLNQKPPYYNAIFEGASLSRQESTIKYIQDNNIEYVTLNISKSTVQDGVPDFIRQAFLFQYILNNYSPIKVLGKHLILKKDHYDFFSSKILEQVRDYKAYLLNIYLYKIPYSEGFYKYDYLVKNSKLLLEESDINKINDVLKKGNFKSEKKVLVVMPAVERKLNRLDSINFQTEKGNSTTIYYNPCKKSEPCIINLSRIPLFYKSKVITNIDLDNDFMGKIKFFELKNPSNLW